MMAGFAVVAAASLLLAAWQASRADDPPSAAYAEIVATARQPGAASVAIAGDTMVGDAANDLIAAEGLPALLAGVEGMLRDADASVVNVEAPITARTQAYDPAARYSYASPPETAPALAAIGVDVLQLGNNHIMDRGAAGIADTTALAAGSGLATVGAGANRAEAARPIVIRTEAGVVGLVSFGEDYGRDRRAGRDSAGMVPFSAAALRQQERVARQAGADWVIALVHWGENYAEIDDAQRYWARALVEAGYDVVVGTGPHLLQPVELIDGTPVAYSIGNFVFSTQGRFASVGRMGLGAVATVTFSGDGGTLALRCIRTDNTVVGFVPRECDPTESAAAAIDLEGGLAWQGPTGTVRF